MASAQAALSEAASKSCWSLSDEQVVAALGAALAVRSGTEAVTASLVGQAESRAVRAQLAQASTAGWLRRRNQASSWEAHPAHLVGAGVAALAGGGGVGGGPGGGGGRRGDHRGAVRVPGHHLALIVGWEHLQVGLAGAGTLLDGTPLSPAATLTAKRATCPQGQPRAVARSGGRGW